MKVIDAHVHLDMNSKNPFKYIEDTFISNKLMGCVLILNTQEEKECFMSNFNVFCKYKNRIHIAAALDIHHLNESKQFYDFLKSHDIYFSIKLHSRMHNITKDDFNAIYEFLKSLNYKSIIVDAFYYGSNLETHIMLELSIYLAKKFPDTNIIMAHFGGYRILETMLCTRELKNIYYDISFTQNYLFGTSILFDMKHSIKFSYNRVMFGSDAPSFSLDEAYENSKKIVSDLGLNADDLKNFYYNTAMEIYGFNI